MKEGERRPFSPKLRVRIKDNNSSPHGKFYRFLFPFSSKFSDLNFALYVLYTVSLGYLCGNENVANFKQLLDEIFVISGIIKVKVSVTSRRP